MQLGMVGLGRMGANIVRRLMRAGHECVVYDVNPKAIEELAGEGARGAETLDDFVAKLDKPRTAWVMVPSSEITESTVSDLASRLESGDAIIDGGNSYYRDDIGIPEIGIVGRELWRQSGLRPDELPMAILYDHFTPYVLMQLEELGFCGRGEAPGFIADGAIEIGGHLPINTHGGQLGEAYIHGMNGIAEAVRQVRGTAVNQVPGDGPVLVTAGTGVPTSGLVLTPSLG